MDERLTYLFNRYFEKTATPDELDELFKVLKTSADDEQLAILMSRAWDNLKVEEDLFSESERERMLERILRTGASEKKMIEQESLIKKMFPWRKFVVAASVFILISAGLWLGQKREKVDKLHIAETNLVHDALPGGNRAVLTLANGTSIILANAHNGVLAKQGKSIVKKTKNGQLVYSAVQSNSAEMPVINTISTPRGGQYQLVLPDGTKVWLNAASSIKYPTFFTGKERIVAITGEAYFEVTKNAVMPFIVKTKMAEIKVLGTHFNIMAYDDEPSMRTTLLEGAVQITSGQTAGILKPGEQAVLDSKHHLQVRDDVDTDDVVAWKDGLFEFNDADVQSIMRQAARWYDVNIIYKGGIPKKQYTGMISRNVKASELLNMLKYTGLNASIDGKNIVISN